MLEDNKHSAEILTLPSGDNSPFNANFDLLCGERFNAGFFANVGFSSCAADGGG